MYTIFWDNDEGVYRLVCSVSACHFAVNIPSNGSHGTGITVADLRHLCPERDSS